MVIDVRNAAGVVETPRPRREVPVSQPEQTVAADRADLTHTAPAAAAAPAQTRNLEGANATANRNALAVATTVAAPQCAGVLGAGVMGSQIAAQLANAGIKTILLDVAPPDLSRLKAMKPSPFFDKSAEKLITTGTFEKDMGLLSKADWIIEAVVEKANVKQKLFTQVDAVRKPGSIVSTNTSGLSVNDLSKGMSEDFRQHFLGTHFFNPPRWTKLFEVIPSHETLPEVTQRMSTIARETLGKGVVNAKDTPDFVANRIGNFALCKSLDYMVKNGYSIEEVDELTGPVSGKPKSATFRTIDLVGLDTVAFVVGHLQKALPNESNFKLPEFVDKMIEKKLLGEKTGQGFYKKTKGADGNSEIQVLDLNTFQYRPRQEVKIESLAQAKAARTLPDKLKIMANATDKGGDFFWNTTGASLAYASTKIPEISDSLVDADNAMKWGFNWEKGPFEVWDTLGVEASAKKLESIGHPVAPWVHDMLDAGCKSFYAQVDGKPMVYDIHSKGYVPVPTDPKVLDLAKIKENPANILKENKDASLLNLGDGVIGLEFHSKMNALGEGILSMTKEALDRLDRDDKVKSLVIGNQGENFSAGANLMLILTLAKTGQFDAIDSAVGQLQDINQRIKYASKPVVLAAQGRALGGGCEMVMHAPKVVASAESYIGLVEIGAGLIPAGGGTKEMLVRAVKAAGGSDPGPNIQKAFETIAFGKVSSSAPEAKELKYLRDGDAVVMNQNYVLSQAKDTALKMADGYRPPTEEKIKVPGQGQYANFLVGIHNLEQGKQITQYEAHLAKKLAFVMCGGNLSAPTEVSEKYILDLERKAFVSLCAEPKTQEKIAYLLKNGKPLRS